MKPQQRCTARNAFLLGLAHVLAAALLDTPLRAESPPYSILLVHGINSSDAVWEECGVAQGGSSMLDRMGLSYGGTLRFDLNKNIAPDSCSQDVELQNPNQSLPRGDYYLVDFSAGGDKSGSSASNESSIFKQGRALGIAIDRISQVTGKRVVIIGHSMGGLAGREYLQRGATAFGYPGTHWLSSDSSHHVLTLITLDTPHLGSNSFVPPVIISKRSEAVRDLRYDYSFVGSREPGSQDDAVYLFGGAETSVPPPPDDYFNQDIDCDDLVESTAIWGLNTRDGAVNPVMPLPTDVSYVWITGRCEGEAYDGDGVVREDRQWVRVRDGRVIHLENTKHSDHPVCVSTGVEPVCKRHDAIFDALDEPDLEYSPAVPVDIVGSGGAFRGYVQRRSDVDWYEFASPEDGEAAITITPRAVSLEVSVYRVRGGTPVARASIPATGGSVRFAVDNDGSYFLRVLSDPSTGPTRYEWYDVSIAISPIEGLCVSPQGVDLGTVGQCQNPPEQFVSITDCVGGVLEWDPRPSSPWIVATKTNCTGTTCASLRVGANTCTLTPGKSYSGEIGILNDRGDVVSKVGVVLGVSGIVGTTDRIPPTRDGTLTLPHSTDCSGYYLAVEWGIETEVAHSYIRFDDLTQVPKGSMVTDASICLHVAQVLGGGPIKICDVTSSSDGCPGGTLGTGSCVGDRLSKDSDEGQWVCYSTNVVDEIVQEWVNAANQCPGTENNGIRIRADGQGPFIRFESADYPYNDNIRPYLRVSYVPNSPPVLDGIPDLVVDEGSRICVDLWNFTRDAQDSTTSRQDYDLELNPDWVTLPSCCSATEHELCAQPPEGTPPGDYAIRVRFEDEGCLSDFDDLTVTVRAVERPPSVSCTTPNAQDTVAEGPYTVRWTDGDVDSDALVEVFVSPDVAGGTARVVASASEDADGSQGQAVWDTLMEDEGRYFVRLRISDGTIESWSQCVGSVIVHNGSQPAVVATRPGDAAVDVDTSTDIRVTFNKLMRADCTVGAISVVPGLSGEQYLAVDGRTLVLDPAASLAHGVGHLVSVSGSVCDMSGRMLGQEHVFAFTTESCCQDDDGDGYFMPRSQECQCPEPIDCDDQNSAVHPESSEQCNCIDDDCDGLRDEGLQDFEADGITNCCDNCPTIANPDQSDMDEDRIGDECEDMRINANSVNSGSSYKRIDGSDLFPLARAFGSKRDSDPLRYDPLADLNRDAQVDGSDLALLAAVWGETVP